MRVVSVMRDAVEAASMDAYEIRNTAAKPAMELFTDLVTIHNPHATNTSNKAIDNIANAESFITTVFSLMF